MKIASFSRALLVLGCLSTAVQAQVNLSLKSNAPAVIKAGEKFTAQLTVRIDKDWHISSTTQPDGGPIRTEISLSDGQAFKLGEIKAPAPHKDHSKSFDMDVETHTGTVVFSLPLTATAEIKPGTKLSVELTYQACDEETCLLPKTGTVTCVLGK